MSAEPGRALGRLTDLGWGPRLRALLAGPDGLGPRGASDGAGQPGGAGGAAGPNSASVVAATARFPAR